MLCGLWGERTTEKVKLLRQFLVIMAVSFVGEILHAVLPLPIPASIYGLVLMLALLMTGALKLDTVEDAGKFMIEIMPVMFIPAGVGLMESWGKMCRKSTGTRFMASPSPAPMSMISSAPPTSVS